MTDINKAILREFLRLKWGEIKWFFKWPILIIIGIFIYYLGCVWLSFKYIPKESYLTDPDDWFWFAYTSDFLAGLMICLISLFFIFLVYMWLKENLKKAKNNLYPKKKKPLKKNRNKGKL